MLCAAPSAHWAYLALSGEVDREGKRERKRFSTDACALIALTAAVYRRAECQSDHLQEQINTAQCLSPFLTHTHTGLSDHTHIFSFLPISSHSRLSHTSLCALQCVRCEIDAVYIETHSELVMGNKRPH